MSKPSSLVAEIGVHFSRGEVVVTDSAITAPSGNPGFDRRVIECFRNLPPASTARLIGDLNLFVRVYSNNGAIALVSNPPPPPFAGYSPVVSPASIGKPHFCDENRYPVAALQTSTEGTTLLGFKITPEGSVENIVVLNSSGSPDLDEASVACAKQWLYRPASQNGVPIEVPWKAMVKWKYESQPAPPFDKIFAAANFCRYSSWPDQDELNQATLATVLRIRFSRGTITNVDIVASSGNTDMDLLIAGCYKSLPPEITSAVTEDREWLIPVDWRSPH
jgi:TonB family protein